MTRHLTRILVPLAVLATVVAGTAVAHAVDTVPPGSTARWPHPAICAEGELAGAVTSTPGQLALTGWVRPCPDADPEAVAQAGLGLAWYHNGQGVLDDGPGLPLASATAPTPVDLRVGPVGRYPQEAVCLVTGPASRVACLWISTGSTGAVTVSPVPVDDPGVREPAVVVADQEINPSCAACV